jgi:hypothetical protein
MGWAALATAASSPGRENVGRRGEEDQEMGKDKDDDKNRDNEDKNRHSGGPGGGHRQEDNTHDAQRDRPIPDRADPNKHDR